MDNKKIFYKVKIEDEWFLMTKETLETNIADFADENVKVTVKSVKMTQEKFNSIEEV
jgi:hypothetical protein